MFCKVNLYVPRGDFVTSVAMPTWQKRPDVINWGPRFFAWDGSRYSEVFVYSVPIDENGDSILETTLAEDQLPLVDDPQLIQYSKSE